jgi:hypothetical protein
LPAAAIAGVAKMAPINAPTTTEFFLVIMLTLLGGTPLHFKET